MNIQPVILRGKLIRLEPLSEKHTADLSKVGLDERIWKYMRYGIIQTPEQMLTWIMDMLKLQRAGTDLPFAVIYQAKEQAIGSTRYLNISQSNRSLEIGGTWYGVDYQRSGVNTEAKYLLLKYAFEQLDCLRVQFKTDSTNLPSQKAIERLGATREGVLRNHMILPDGRLRDSVFYSIIPEEWPSVKAHLEYLMKKTYTL